MRKEEFENFLFRYRGQIPVIGFLVFLCISLLFEFQIVSINIHTLRTIALFIIFLGFFSRCFTVGYAAPHSSGRNRNMQVANQLNTLGAYSMVQHPLYFSNSLLWVGTGLISNQWGLFSGSLCLIWLLYRPLIRRETLFLTQTFGSEYKEWKNLTPVFFPNPFQYIKPKTSFDWLRLFATEYPTWVSILAGILTSLLFSNVIPERTILWRDYYTILIITSISIGLMGRFFKYIVVRKWLNKSI